MRWHDRQGCLAGWERDIRGANERLDGLCAEIYRLVGERRAESERRFDQARGLFNRSLARLEALRRAPRDAWEGAADQAEEAVVALRRVLAELDGERRTAAA